MCKKRGFTLIELLVVVLIIGILAAVTLPKYQVAIEKARATEALSNGRLLQKQQNLHYLASGEMPSLLEDLSVQVPASRYFSYGIISGHNIITARRKTRAYWFEFVSLTSGARDNGRSYCATDTSLGQKVCQSLGGVLDHGSSVKYYLLP